MVCVAFRFLKPRVTFILSVLSILKFLLFIPKSYQLSQPLSIHSPNCDELCV